MIDVFAQLPPRARASALKLQSTIDDPSISRAEIDHLIATALMDAAAEGRALAVAASAPAKPIAAVKTDHGWGKHIAAINARLGCNAR